MADDAPVIREGTADASVPVGLHPNVVRYHESGHGDVDAGFEKADLVIVLYTDEPEDRINQLIRNVEFRCPVMNLMRAADVKLSVDWQVRPAPEFSD